jgi:hypothetical protein
VGNRAEFVKLFRWIVVGLLLGASVYVSVEPRPDLPETTFNEADAPVNLAPPVRPRIQIVSPAPDPIATVSGKFVYCPRCGDRLLQKPSVTSYRYDRKSLRDLLCTLLI